MMPPIRDGRFDHLVTAYTNAATSIAVPSVESMLDLARDLERKFPPARVLARVRCSPYVAARIRAYAIPPPDVTEPFASPTSPADPTGITGITGIEFEVDCSVPPQWCEFIYQDGSRELLLPGGGTLPLGKRDRNEE